MVNTPGDEVIIGEEEEEFLISHIHHLSTLSLSRNPLGIFDQNAEEDRYQDEGGSQEDSATSDRGHGPIPVSRFGRIRASNGRRLSRAPA